jgi:hypothetical protein
MSAVLIPYMPCTVMYKVEMAGTWTSAFLA